MGVISYNGILYGGGGGNTNAVYLTQAEYDALPDTKLTDGKVYFIEDATPAPDFTEAAENVFYNGTAGQPDNVQGMLEQTYAKADTCLTFSPVSASENGQLTNALLVDLTNPKAAVNAPQKVGYTYTTENMPENCAWGIRTVNWVAENFLAVQINGMMLNSNTAAIWINTYNNGAWTGWICIGGVNSDGWIDITDECTWIADTRFNTGVHKKFVRYNPFTGQVIGSFYAYGEMHNQSILLTLPDYVPAEYVGACGIASTNKLMSLFPRYDSNRNIVSSHTIAENTGNRTIYMLDFFTRNSIQNIRQAQ